MPYLYSASTPGFYHTDIHGEDIPADAVEISDEEHRALLDQQATGLEIRPGANGRPVAMAPETSTEELATRLRIRRDALLDDCDWTQLPDAPLTAAQRDLWAAYRQALRDLPQTFATDLSAVAWPIPPLTV